MGMEWLRLMDLSQAFDTLSHNLLIAKLHAHGFTTESLKLVKSYLTNRCQRTKVNKNFSSWSWLLIEYPQGSVLGPWLFNTYINDLFYVFEMTNVCNYADDATFHACDSHAWGLRDEFILGWNFISAKTCKQ